MKRLIIMTAALAGLTLSARAAEHLGGLAVDSLTMSHSGDFLTVRMTLDLSEVDVKSNSALLFTPRLVNDSDTLTLPAVGIYGRRRFYHYLRNSDGAMLSGKDELSYKASDKPQTISYSQVLPYQEWMNGADLALDCSEYGCCNKTFGVQSMFLEGYKEKAAFFPLLVYSLPKGETVKSDSLEGSAFIDFPVNKTDINPDYHSNFAELGKIQATIDSVRSDRDVSITKVWLKGYASPESPYDNNKKLAIGRTESLSSYIKQLYHFPDGVIATDYEAEDWDGLRRYVEDSNITHRDEILDIIDCDLDPDAKEAKIKSAYPEDYRFLLQNCYPALRHTDYRIAYNIRSYNDADEIERIMHSQPQKLSLNEFYILAQKYPPGSEEFSEVYETAVRMYPADETANLNAANAAMRRGDNEAAARYLAKAGDSPEAVYARGALAMLSGDNDAARRYLEEAQQRGVRQADFTIQNLE